MKRVASPALTPSSMAAGNTVADDGGLSMTGPGSPSSLPVPDAMDRLPMPVVGEPAPMVVAGAALLDNQSRVDGHPDAGAGRWHDPGYIDEGGTDSWGWTET